MAAIMLLVWARRAGVNMSALGIGVDFLQIVSMFTAFGFTWPSELTSLFKVASTSTFNEQLMAPECSLSGWGFQMKCVACTPVIVSLALTATLSWNVALRCTSAWCLFACLFGRWFMMQSVPLLFIFAVGTVTAVDVGQVRAWFPVAGRLLFVLGSCSIDRSIENVLRPLDVLAKY